MCVQIHNLTEFDDDGHELELECDFCKGIVPTAYYVLECSEENCKFFYCQTCYENNGKGKLNGSDDEPISKLPDSDDEPITSGATKNTTDTTTATKEKEGKGKEEDKKKEEKDNDKGDMQAKQIPTPVNPGESATKSTTGTTIDTKEKEGKEKEKNKKNEEKDKEKGETQANKKTTLKQHEESKPVKSGKGEKGPSCAICDSNFKDDAPLPSTCKKCNMKFCAASVCGKLSYSVDKKESVCVLCMCISLQLYCIFLFVMFISFFVICYSLLFFVILLFFMFLFQVRTARAFHVEMM